MLRSNDRNRVATIVAPDEDPRVAFMFPGGGSQYNGMAAGLDASFDVFHDVHARRHRARAGPHGRRPRAAAAPRDADEGALLQATAFMPAIFTTSIALARQWMAWGVRPTTYLGHSLGEYAAAHLAGVLTFDGALDLIAARARLIEEISGSGAAMMAVPLAEDAVRAVLPATLSLATVNATDECTVAGPTDDILALRDRLAADDVTATVVPIAAAGHSSMLDPILPAFLEAVRQVELSPPQVPYVSNLTGTWITAEQATDPQYWVDHLRHTVRFADCLTTLLADGPTVLRRARPGPRALVVRPAPGDQAGRRDPGVAPPEPADGRHRVHPARLRALLGRRRRHRRRPLRRRRPADGAAPGLPVQARAALDRSRGGLAQHGRRGPRTRRDRDRRRAGRGRARPASRSASPTSPTRSGPRRGSTRRPIAPAIAPVGPWLVVGDPADAFVAAARRRADGSRQRGRGDVGPRPGRARRRPLRRPRRSDGRVSTRRSSAG